jgi:hypothetical protein
MLWLNYYAGDGVLLEEERAGDFSAPVSLTPDAETVIAYLIRIESFKVCDALGQLAAFRPGPPPLPEADHAVPAAPSPPPSPHIPW